MDKTVNFTEDELRNLRDAVSETLTLVKRSVAKRKVKIVGKSLLSAVLIAGGVAVAIVFPSPITLAVLGGAAALIGGSNGVVGDIRGVRRDSVRARGGKKDLRAIESEMVSRRATRDIIDSVSRQSNPPSAPPMYPSLQQQY